MTFSTRTMLAATAALILVAPLAPAQADFSDYYAPANWTLLNVDSDGFVDASGAPASLTLVGSDNGSGSFGDTYLWIAVPESGTVSFDWLYTSDDDPGFDSSWFAVGDDVSDFENITAIYTALSDTGGESGSLSIAVNAGQLIAFNVDSEDGLFGPGVLTISDFSAPLGSVPEPATWAMMIGGFALAGAAMRRRKVAVRFA